MTDIKTAIRAQILASPQMAAIVGTRVYAYGAPDNATRPYVIFGQEGDTEAWRTLGSSGAVELTTWTLDAYATTWTQARMMMSYLRYSLEFIGPTSWSGVSVITCVIQGERENPYFLTEGSAEAMPRMTLTIKIKSIK